jgi:hypothetical protein
MNIPSKIITKAKEDGATAFACFYTYNPNDGQELFAVSFFVSKIPNGENLVEISTWSRWMNTYQLFMRPFWKNYIASYTKKSGGYGDIFDL